MPSVTNARQNKEYARHKCMRSVTLGIHLLGIHRQTARQTNTLGKYTICRAFYLAVDLDITGCNLEVYSIEDNDIESICATLCLDLKISQINMHGGSLETERGKTNQRRSLRGKFACHHIKKDNNLLC